MCRFSTKVGKPGFTETKNKIRLAMPAPQNKN